MHSITAAFRIVNSPGTTHMFCSRGHQRLPCSRVVAETYGLTDSPLHFVHLLVRLTSGISGGWRPDRTRARRRGGRDICGSLSSSLPKVLGQELFEVALIIRRHGLVDYRHVGNELWEHYSAWRRGGGSDGAASGGWWYQVPPGEQGVQGNLRTTGRERIGMGRGRVPQLVSGRRCFGAPFRARLPLGGLRLLSCDIQASVPEAVGFRS